MYKKKIHSQLHKKFKTGGILNKLRRNISHKHSNKFNIVQRINILGKPTIRA